MEAIEAVDRSRPVCRISDFTEKTRKMKVIRQAGRTLDLDYGHYGLLQADGNSYEKIFVSETDAVQMIKLKDALQMPYTVNAPISRIVFGSVDAEGNYLLRIRNNSDRQDYLLRYVVKGEVCFQQADFSDPENFKLTAHEKKAKPVHKKEESEETNE